MKYKVSGRPSILFDDLDALEKKMFDKHTEKRPAVMEGASDAHTVWLRVGVQQFCVSGVYAEESAEHAEWLRAMLAKALANVIRLNATPDAITGEFVGTTE